MPLLFDANLSPKLVRRLADLFPESRHVQEIGLTSSDALIWSFAVANDLIIVTKDDDFKALALIMAPPGKVILIGLGNCETDSVEALFRRQVVQLLEFFESASETLLLIP